MTKLVLLRHGESVWNSENRFTGWIDVGLSERGRVEAQQAGRTLRAEGFTFDIAYTSVLRRAIETLWIVLDELDLMWIPVERSWRLNERHYGALQGLNKADCVVQFGEALVHTWRRGYDTPPPPLAKTDPTCPGLDPRYRGLDQADVPLTESLKDTVNRFLPYWYGTVVPVIESGRRVIVVSHQNNLRALVKVLDEVPDDVIPSLSIPTGIPLVYELDDHLRPVRSYYLGTPGTVVKSAEMVPD